MKMIYALLIILLTVQVFGATGRIKKEDLSYIIDWDLEEQGYSHDGKYYLTGDIKCKIEDCNFDMAFISPEPFKSGSQLIAKYKVLKNVSVLHKFKCNSDKFGWIEQGQSLFCNYTNPANGTSDEFDTMIVKNITSDYVIYLPIKTIYWFENVTRLINKEVDLTPQFQYTNDYSTIYGDNIYYSNINAKSNLTYNIEVVINADVSEPLKYSIAFGNITSRELYFILDPTITNSRTWTITEDFENETILNNITATDDEIKLDSEISTTNITAYWTHDNEDKTSTSIFDVVDRTNDCNITGTIDNTTGIVNQGGYYNNDNCKVNDESNFDIPAGTSFSVGGWVRFNSSGSFMGIVSKGATAGYGINRRAGSPYRMFFQVQASDCGTTVLAENTSQPTTTDVDYFLVGIFNSSSQDLLFYVNNHLEERDSLGDSSICNNNYKLTIGNRDEGSSVPIDGMVDEFFFYNRALNEIEIEAMYNSGAGKQYPFPLSNGSYSDLQEWSPTSGGTLKNITFEATEAGATFYYNKTNTSLDTSIGYDIPSGSSNVSFDLDADDSIFYKIMFDGGGTITSYTINEESGGAPTPGTLTYDLISPTGNTNHTQNEFVLRTLQVNCTGGDCGNVNVTLDPTENYTYVSGGAGEIGNFSTNFALSHDSTTGTIDEFGFHNVRYREDSGTYYIERLFVPIDTSPLPDNAVISDANFFINVGGRSGLHNLTIYHSTQAQDNDITVTDYDECSNTHITPDIYFVSSLPVSGWINFSLNSTGINLINLTGSSFFCAKFYEDALNITPYSGGNSYITINSIGDYYLRVGYTNDSTNNLPTITLNSPTNNTNISINSTWLNITVSDADSDDINLTFINNSNSATLCTNNTRTAGVQTTCYIPMKYEDELKWYVNYTDNGTIQQSGLWNYSITNLTPVSEPTLKSGAISTVAGTIPFYTSNTSNPTDACGSMTDGDTCIIGFYVNATGEIGTVHDFFWIIESDDESVTDVNSTHFNITIDGGSPAGDSCTAPGSGNWNVDCSDNCVINTEQEVPGNLTLTGSGRMILFNNLTFTGNNQYIYVNSGCEIDINSGGGIKSV